MDKFGPFRTSLDHFGQVSTILDNLKPFWTSLNYFGQHCIHSDLLRAKKTYARLDATDDEVFIIHEEEEEVVVSAKGKLSKDLGRISRPRRNMN